MQHTVYTRVEKRKHPGGIVPKKKNTPYPRLVVVGIGPVPMEFDNVWVLELREILKNELNFFLLVLKVFTFGKLNLVPNDFDSFFCIHGQVGAVDSRHISLFHLEKETIDQADS